MGCPVEDGTGAELIVAYGARKLDPEQESELERHLTLCPSCRELAQAQRAVWSALDAWPSIAVSPNFDELVFHRIANEQQRTPFTGWLRRWLPARWSWRPVVPVGAACAALIAAFLLKSPVLQPLTPSENQPKLQIEQVEHALDDMDMLKQLGVESASEKAHSPEKI